MSRNLRISDLSPIDVLRITERALLLAHEYERYVTEDLSDEQKQTLRILTVMAVADDVIAKGGDGDDREKRG